MNGPIRVLVLVSHRMVREGLSLLLEEHPGIEVAGAVASVDEALTEAGSSPDVVIVDLDHASDDSRAVAALRDALPGVPLVGFTDSDDPALVSGVLDLGVSSVYVKTLPSEALIELIERVAAGEVEVRVALPDLGPPPPPRSGDPLASGALGERLGLKELTRRELQILGELTEGKGTTQVSASLGISPLTVQSHVKSILAKLNVHSKIEAITLAIRYGVVNVPVTRRSGQASGDRGSTIAHDQARP